MRFFGWREALKEFRTWNIGRYPYEHLPTCGTCITQHAHGMCSDPEHQNLTELATRIGLKISGTVGDILPGKLRRYYIGCRLLTIKSETINLREGFCDLYKAKSWQTMIENLNSIEELLNAE